MQVHRQRQAQRERPHGPVEATFGQYRRMDAANQGAQLGQGLPARCARLGQQGQRQVGVVPEHLLGEPDVHAEGDQPGLRPVVQVPLDPAQFGRRSVHRLGAGLGSAGPPARPSPPGSGPAATTAAQACALSSQRSQRRRPGGSRLRKNTCPQKPGGAVLHQPNSKLPPSATNVHLPATDHERGQQPEHHAHRHVDQRPEQVPPGRGIGEQPLAALQPPDQPVGRSPPAGAGRASRSSPPTTAAPSGAACWPASARPAGSSARAAPRSPRKARGRESTEATNSGSPASAATASTSPRTQTCRVRWASRPKALVPSLIPYLPLRICPSASIVRVGGPHLGGVNSTI